MNRPISTRMHGMIDYTFAATLIGLPFALGWRGRAAMLSIGSGVATLATSLLTRYELGVIPLLPMKTHLAIDAAESSMLMTAPRMLRDDDAPSGRILAALGAIGAAVGSMTQREPRMLDSRAVDERQSAIAAR
jgi:hypothetical protein